MSKLSPPFTRGTTGKVFRPIERFFVLWRFLRKKNKQHGRINSLLVGKRRDRDLRRCSKFSCAGQRLFGGFAALCVIKPGSSVNGIRVHEWLGRSRSPDAPAKIAMVKIIVLGHSMLFMLN
jgi:hypothetical protein